MRVLKKVSEEKTIEVLIEPAIAYIDDFTRILEIYKQHDFPPEIVVAVTDSEDRFLCDDLDDFLHNFKGKQLKEVAITSNLTSVSFLPNKRIRMFIGLNDLPRFKLKEAVYEALEATVVRGEFDWMSLGVLLLAFGCVPAVFLITAPVQYTYANLGVLALALLSLLVGVGKLKRMSHSLVLKRRPTPSRFDWDTAHKVVVSVCAVGALIVAVYAAINK